MSGNSSEGWFSGWTIAVVLALLLAILGFGVRSELKTIAGDLERGSAEALIDGLERNRLYNKAEGQLSQPLISIGQLPASADVASGEALDALSKETREQLANLTGSQEITNERLLGVEVALDNVDAERAALVAGLTDAAAANQALIARADAQDQSAADIAATINTQAEAMIGLQTDVAGLESDLTNLGTAQNEATRAIGNRISGLSDRLEATETQLTQAAVAAGAMQAAHDAHVQASQDSFNLVSGALQKHRDSSTEKLAQLAAEQLQHKDALTSVQAGQQQTADELTATKARLAQAETAQAASAQQLASLLARLDAMEQQLTALPQDTPVLAWRGGWQGAVQDLGQLSTGDAYDVHIKLAPSSAGSLRIVIDNGAAPISHELVSFSAEAVDTTVSIPYSAGLLRLEGDGGGVLELTVSLRTADDDF